METEILATMVALITALTEAASRLAQKVGLKLEGFKAQLVSWLIGVALGLGGVVLGWIDTLPQGVLDGFLAALVANGVFDIPLVKALLEFLRIRKRA